MKVTTLAALLLAYCILVACTRTSPNAQLVQADSLMQKSPDSALHFLEKIYPEKLKSLEDQAYYALLVTQARKSPLLLGMHLEEQRNLPASLKQIFHCHILCSKNF